jgi:hypothetical protein
MRNIFKILAEKHRRRDHLEDLDVERRIVLKYGS